MTQVSESASLKVEAKCAVSKIDLRGLLLQLNFAFESRLDFEQVSQQLHVPHILMLLSLLSIYICCIGVLLVYM